MVVDHKMSKLCKTKNQALRLGSKIRDMEADLTFISFGMQNWHCGIIELKCQIVGSLYGVWPLTASMEVKNKYAYAWTPL